MAIRFVNASLGGLTTTNQTVYTCPAGVTAVVMGVNGANAGSSMSTLAVNTSVKKSGVTSVLSQHIEIAAASSAALVPTKVGLSAGDSIECSVNLQSSISAFKLVAGSPANVLSFARNGGVICAFLATGVYRSTDHGDTWTLVSQLAGGSSSAYIGTNFYSYTSTTTAIKSTDNGLTWTSIAVTNAPNAAAGTVDSIVYNGTVWGGLNGGTVMTTTSNGETWTLATAFPFSCSSLVWSGNRWVAGRNATSSDICWSTDGAAWTTVSTIPGAGTTGISNKGMASDGAGRLVAVAASTGGTITFSYSADHGLTWVSCNTSPFQSSATKYAAYINAKFVLIWVGSTTSSVSVGDNPLLTGAKAVVTSQNVSVFNNNSSNVNIMPTGSKIVSSGSFGVFQSKDMNFSPYGGAEITVSVMEQY